MSWIANSSGFLFILSFFRPSGFLFIRSSEFGLMYQLAIIALRLSNNFSEVKSKGDETRSGYGHGPRFTPPPPKKKGMRKNLGRYLIMLPVALKSGS